MGKFSKIEWTDHTFNPWWGCQKVSPGCDKCYAETLDKKTVANTYDGQGNLVPQLAPHWGRNSPRRFFAQGHWDEVYRWDRQAQDSETPVKVFCGSMCDILEDRPDLYEPRQKLFKLIKDTSNLTWLLLTKRPENAERMFPPEWVTDSFPTNVWLGVSIETQKYIWRLADISYLPVKNFVSVEPMLGMVDFTPYWWCLSWCIIGPETGVGARPIDMLAAAILMKECLYRFVPVFMKTPANWRRSEPYWPPQMQLQQFPNFDEVEKDLTKRLPKPKEKS